MPETIIESVLNGKLDSALLTRWLNNESIDDAPDDCILHCCKRSEFVAYFLSFLRNQTDKILQTNTNAIQIIQNSTPDKLLNRKHHRSISDPTNNDRITDNLSVKSGSVSQSPSRDRKRTGRKVKTKLFPDEKKDGNMSISSDESHLSTSIEKLAISSTPLKNGIKVTDYPNLSLASPLTPRYVKEHERCDTPRLHRHSRSQEKHCLGDYLVSATKQKKKSKKNTSSDKEDKTELDLSNSDMFPEIGTRKSSSLRSEKRRIKPTNIDTSQKSISSVSLNSFTAECFQQPSIHALEDNSAFKQQNIETSRTSNYEAERNILKQERHKLMEKFNILNTSTPVKQVTPQIKITQKESMDVSKVFLKADVTKILMKEKIDYIINIYDSLMRNNLVLSVNTEMYFLISILISKQCEDDYLDVQSKLNDNNIHYLLKSIDNCTYFAVKALWNERAMLEVILDKNSLKTLGENKTLRSFYPELAKFLLNTYCLRCENVPVQQPVTSSSQTVVCYNIETDHVDNFSGMHAFHHFKKQRDMFYDIVRWYQSDRSLAPHPSLSRRVRSLLAAGGGSLSQLARLVVLHMMGACLTQTAQESKLSKLQRRLTCPSASDTNRLPHFTPSEMFYKEFLIYADNESFRVHFKDVLSSEILTLDSTHITLEDKGNSNTETSQEYIQLIKKLSLLAKFLGFTCAAPYSNYTDVNIKNSAAITSDSHSTPKERVLENSLAVRNYSQPSIDFKTVLQNAIDNHRLSITIPWLVQYLSMLDYTTLRLKYYSELLKKLHDIYLEKLKLTPSDLKMTPSDLKTSSSESKNSSTCDLRDVKNTSNSESKSTSNCDLKSTSNSDLLTNSKTNLKITPRKDLRINTSDTKKSNDDLKNSTSDLKKNTKIYLKSLLGWLFDLPHFPTDFQETSTDNSVGNEKIDSVDLVDESSILELCPSLKEVNILLSTCRLSSDRKENTFRHITPVSLNVNPEDRIKNKEKEMQSRLRAALLRAQPPSIRRSLELVASCACGAALHDVATGLGRDAALTRLTQRAAAALAALVPSAGAALRHVAGAAARERFHAALASNHTSAGASISAPMEVPKIPKPDYSVPLASHLITLKEHLCRVVEGGAGAAGAGAGAGAGPAAALRAAAALAAAAGLARRPLASLALDLCLVYVAHRPSEVTASFLSSLHAVWHVACPDRRRESDRDRERERERERERDREREREHSPCASPERAPTPDSDADVGPTLPHVGPTTSDGQTTSNNVPQLPNTSKNVTKLTINTRSTKQKSRSIPNSPTLYTCVGPTFTRSIPTSPIALNPTYVATVVNNTTKVNNTSSNEEELLDLFNRLLCCRNIVMLSSSRCEPSAVWRKMADVLVFLLNHHYLSEDSLTEQCLAVYRQDWPQSTLLQLSACMKAVAQQWANSTSGKFTLFLDFLAEYCGDLDYEH